MTTYELRRIAQIYGATEADVREAEHTAALAPLVPLGHIRLNVMVNADQLVEEPPNAHP